VFIIRLDVKEFRARSPPIRHKQLTSIASEVIMFTLFISILCYFHSINHLYSLLLHLIGLAVSAISYRFCQRSISGELVHVSTLLPPKKSR